MRSPDGRVVPDPEVQPTMSAQDIADALGVSLRTAYRMIADDVWPTLRVGRETVVPTVPFRDWLHLNER